MEWSNVSPISTVLIGIKAMCKKKKKNYLYRDEDLAYIYISSDQFNSQINK